MSHFGVKALTTDLLMVATSSPFQKEADHASMLQGSAVQKHPKLPLHLLPAEAGKPHECNPAHGLNKPLFLNQTNEPELFSILIQ